MRDERRNYVIVGVFVAVVLAGLILGLALLSGRTGATDDYHVVYDNVMGLGEGTRVLYEGYPIGRIDSIAPVEADGRRRFRVEVDVRRGWQIPEDSTAQVTASGLLSAVVIEIRGGTSGRALEPGARIRDLEAPSVFAVVSSVAAEFQELTRESLRPLIASLAERAPEIVDELDAFATKLGATMGRIDRLLSDRNTQRVERTLANMETSSRSFVRVTRQLGETQGRVDELLLALNALLEGNEEDVDQAIADLRHSLETVAEHIDAISHNLEITSRNMSEFSRQLRSNPGVLIRGRADGDSPAEAE